MRGAISTLINLLSVNRNLKYVMWDNIERSNWPSLLLRVSQQNVCLFVTFFALKSFPLTTVAITNNMASFTVVIFGYLFLAERLTRLQTASLLVAFTGVVLMILAGEEESPTEEISPEAMQASFWSLVTLCMNPFLISGGILAMRQMRKMNEQTMSCYMNLTLMVAMLATVSLTGSDMRGFSDLDAFSWFNMCTMSLSVVVS
jgi:drug/metabolite transporter (DMT)-like permease